MVEGIRVKIASRDGFAFVPLLSWTLLFLFRQFNNLSSGYKPPFPRLFRLLGYFPLITTFRSPSETRVMDGKPFASSKAS